jgi:hypothetical protein
MRAVTALTSTIFLVFGSAQSVGADRCDAIRQAINVDTDVFISSVEKTLENGKRLESGLPAEYALQLVK